MRVVLKPVERDDIERVWKMQIKAFSDLLQRYRDYDMSPGAESVDFMKKIEIYRIRRITG